MFRDDSSHQRKSQQWDTRLSGPSLLSLPLLVSGDTPYKVDAQQIHERASLLQRYLSDELKELQALYALQALMVHMEQPASEY